MEWLASTVLVLGIGTCDGSGDYCVRPMGEVRLEQSIVEAKKHSLWGTATHFSEPGNERTRDSDYGTNIFMLEYRYRIR